LDADRTLSAAGSPATRAEAALLTARSTTLDAGCALSAARSPAAGAETAGAEAALLAARTATWSLPALAEPALLATGTAAVLAEPTGSSAVLAKATGTASALSEPARPTAVTPAHGAVRRSTETVARRRRTPEVTPPAAVEGPTVDIDVSIAPTRPCPAPKGCDRCNAGAEQQALAHDAGTVTQRRLIIDRRRVLIRPGAVHHGRIVVGHVHHVRLRGLDHHDIVLRAHDLLWRALQAALDLCRPPQPLDGFEHHVLLHGHGVADLLHPVELSAHSHQDLRERHQ